MGCDCGHCPTKGKAAIIAVAVILGMLGGALLVGWWLS